MRRATTIAPAHLDYLYASGFLQLLGSPWHFNALAQEFTQKYWVHGHMFGSEGLDFGPSLASSEVFLVIGSNPWMSSGFQRARDLVSAIGAKEITAIYSPNRGRNQETVQPLATQLGVTITLIPEARLSNTRRFADEFVQEVLSKHAGGVVVWVDMVERKAGVQISADHVRIRRFDKRTGRAL